MIILLQYELKAPFSDGVNCFIVVVAAVFVCLSFHIYHHCEKSPVARANTVFANSRKIT